MKKIIKLVLAISLVSILLVGCGNGEDTATENGNGDSPTLVKIGLTGSDSGVWEHVKEEAAKENIEIELVFFDSYPLPNAALNSGEIDLNSFQHYIYLETEIEQFGYELSVIGDTYYAPLGIYSKQIESLDELEDGAQIVIPDDVTNGGRALLLLQEQGLIEVDPAAGLNPTVKDVTNPRNFDVIELGATNIPASLEEAPIAVINSGVATDAGLVPAEDSIVLEDASSGDNPYVNVIVARTEDKDNEVYNRIVEIFQTDATKGALEEEYKGSLIPVW